MDKRMDSTILNIGAAVTIGLVALFPSPAAFQEAVFPSEPHELNVVDAEDQTLELEIVTFGTPRPVSVKLPPMESCRNALTQQEIEAIQSCENDLYDAVSATTHRTEPVLPANETARVALTRLCQADWRAMPAEGPVTPPTSCVRLLEE